MKSIGVRGVSVQLGRLPVLDDVSLCVQAGRARMLAGPNGAGKSTLMKVMLGLVRPDFGIFEVDGERAAIDDAWKARIGYLPEAVAFSDNLTGRQLLSFFARARGVAAERVDAVLSRAGLEHAARRAIRGYSRGMRQRLGLAVAILAEPPLLILDEPTAGLDQQGLAVLWSVLEEWRAAGRMVLVATHDLALMERRVDEICVLRGGRVVADGSCEELRRRAALPHRIRLDVGGASDARIELLCAAIRSWGRGIVEKRADWLIASVPPDALLELIEIQSGFAGVVRGIRVEEPTMDLVYDALLEVA